MFTESCNGVTNNCNFISTHNSTQFRFVKKVWEHYPSAGKRHYMVFIYDMNAKWIAQGGSPDGFESAVSQARRNLLRRINN